MKKIALLANPRLIVVAFSCLFILLVALSISNISHA